MKIVIQEVTFHREGCITTNTTLDSDFKYSWERGLVELKEILATKYSE